MSPERWKQIEGIFHQAVELDAAGRRRFLDEACAGDAELLGEVASLLTHETSSDERFDSAVKGAAAALTSQEAFAGRRIGVWRLVKEIGRGGMGAVYLAERDDEHFRKQVAVKLIKRGMDTQFVIERFRHERQILASLDHPYIARLLDGGSTEDGLPFFVMDYIEGRPIHRYSDEEKLDTRARCRLFREVCSAVSYAHQNLIVHRDLKPSNVLVTVDGSPRLLDFGLAKLLSDQGPEFTQTAMPMLTPDYASPEQVRGETITTATDVYCLGAMLYELLTGTRPHRISSYTAGAIERAICEREVERPSAVSGRRELRGDLDTILLTALRKDPAQRYHSVEQFSDDLRRYLEGLPVRARPRSAAYIARKFVRRHGVGVAVAALVFFSLLGGIIASMWQAGRADQQRQLAEHNRLAAEHERTRAQEQTRLAEQSAQLAVEQWRRAEREKRAADSEHLDAERRFQLVRQLAGKFLFDIEDSISQLPGGTGARKLVVKTALEYFDTLAREKLHDDPLRIELAQGYKKLGQVQGNPFGPNLGDTSGAAESYGKSCRLLEEVLARNPSNVAVGAELAESYSSLALVISHLGNSAQAQVNIDKALTLINGLRRRGPDDVSLKSLAVEITSSGAVLFLGNGRLNDALQANQEAIRLSEELLKQNPSDREIRHRLAGAYSSRGRILTSLEDLNGALAVLQKAPASSTFSRPPASGGGWRRQTRRICWRGWTGASPWYGWEAPGYSRTRQRAWRCFQRA
ncbi:MAG: protein kinase [Acidobacteria bacterium]|nr:protein kinase [Acidobacteriota bacterium]